MLQYQRRLCPGCTCPRGACVLPSHCNSSIYHRVASYRWIYSSVVTKCQRLMGTRGTSASTIMTLYQIPINTPNQSCSPYTSSSPPSCRWSLSRWPGTYCCWQSSSGRVSFARPSAMRWLWTWRSPTAWLAFSCCRRSRRPCCRRRRRRCPASVLCSEWSLSCCRPSPSWRSAPSRWIASSTSVIHLCTYGSPNHTRWWSSSVCTTHCVM